MANKRISVKGELHSSMKAAYEVRVRCIMYANFVRTVVQEHVWLGHSQCKKWRTHFTRLEPKTWYLIETKVTEMVNDLLRTQSVTVAKRTPG